MSTSKKLLVVFLFMITRIWHFHSYYLSPNRYDWHNANLFCKKHCKSELASIHSTNDQNEAWNMITNSISYQTITTSLYDIDDIWIGLKWDNTLNQYLWSDGSSFDFVSWSPFQPDYTSNYVILSKQNSYYWKNHESTDVLLRPLCNSCDTQLTKYVFMTHYNNWYSSESLCITTGTHSASIHSVRDQNEIITVINATYTTYGDHVWIGLTDNPTTNIWHWSDNTSFDFGNNISGGIYPWSDDGKKEPNGDSEHCVNLPKYYEWHWNNDNCTTNSNTICNIHSEICNPSTIWVVGFGVPNKIDNQCDGIVMWADANDGSASYRISNKQWVNYNKLLVIEYMFQLKKKDTKTEGHGGIALWNLMDGSAFYGMYVSQYTNDWFISVGKWLNSQWYHGESAILPSSMSSDRFYLLTCKIQNGNSFELLINGISYINYTDDSEYNDRGKNSILSGSIGVYTDDATITAKSLFVSGGWNTDGMPPTSPPISATTKIPTKSPTNQPSKTPTNVPSLFPSKSDTLYPSNIPTKQPTEAPTNIPTKYPSKLPTLYPSKSPTLYPSKSPTLYPSHSPTITKVEQEVEDPKTTETRSIYQNTNKNNIENDELNVFGDDNMLYIIIGIALCCIVGILSMLWIKLKKRRRLKSKPNELDTNSKNTHKIEMVKHDEVNMTELQQIASISNIVASLTNISVANTLLMENINDNLANNVNTEDSPVDTDMDIVDEIENEMQHVTAGNDAIILSKEEIEYEMNGNIENMTKRGDPIDTDSGIEGTTDDDCIDDDEFIVDGNDESPVSDEDNEFIIIGDDETVNGMTSGQ